MMQSGQSYSVGPDQLLIFPYVIYGGLVKEVKVALSVHNQPGKVE